MDGVNALVVGSTHDRAHPDCAAAIARLSRHTVVEHVADLESAAVRLADPRSTFELIALAEPRPGHYSTDQIDALRNLAPLVRVWRLLGSWCEGEQRSGQPPLACCGTYWHRLPARLASAFEAVRAGGCPTWGLPLTATADEQLLAAAEFSPGGRAGRIVVCAARAEGARALADACRLGGYETEWIVEGDRLKSKSAQAVVWDMTTEQATDRRRIKRLRRAAGGAPVVAVVGFPREHETRQAIASGVSEVVSKPYLVRDLLWHVERAVTARRCP